MAMNNVQLLWMLVAAQLFLIGLAWTAAIPMSRIFRSGVVGLVAFNLVLGLSFLLIGFRDVLPYFVGHTFSNLLSLWALVAIIQAGGQLLRIQISQKEIWVVMTLAGLGILALGLDKSTADLRATLVFVTVAWLLSRNGLQIWRLQPEPRLRAPVKSIAAISLAIAALLLVRAVAGLFLHDAIEFSATDLATLAMPFVVLAGASLVNLGFAYLAISTVVTTLGEKARTDELTGLLNRQALTDQINRRWARFTKSGEPFALLCIDIDNLRSVNVAHGYAGGDRVLKEVSQVLLRRLKPGDAIGRAGGGKMVGILTGVKLADAGVMAECMRLEVAEVQDLFSDARTKISASIGVAVSVPSDTSEDVVLARANANLAAAKAGGRNRVEIDRADSWATIQ